MMTTPFPRTSSSATGGARAALPDPRLRIRDDLRRARRFYDLNAGELDLLELMLWIMPRGGRAIYAGNKKLAKDKGISIRSVSRHLAQLEAQGFITKNPSPNGKRYKVTIKAKGSTGSGPEGKAEVMDKEVGDAGKEVVYGFDLSPVFERAAEFAARAQEADIQDRDIAVCLNRLSLLRVRLESRGGQDDLVERLKKARRRAWSPTLLADLEDLAREARAGLGEAETEAASRPAAETDTFAPKPLPVPADDLSTNDSHSVRHQQSRNDRVFSRADRSARPVAAERNSKEGLGRGEESGHRQLRLDPRPSLPVDKDPGSTACEPPAPEPDRDCVRAHAERILAELRFKLSAQSKPRLRESQQEAVAEPLCVDATLPRADREATRPQPAQASAARDPRHPPPLPASSPGLPDVEAVLQACPSALSLSGDRPRSWSQLFEAAWQIGGWIGIADKVMAEASRTLGRDGLAVTLFALCERQATIRQPAAYLRTLCARPGFQPSELLGVPQQDLRDG